MSVANEQPNHSFKLKTVPTTSAFFIERGQFNRFTRKNWADAGRLVFTVRL